MKALTDYVVPLSGLAFGVHEFDFQADWKFFEQIEDSAVEQGLFQVKLTLDKQHDHVVVTFDIHGSLDTNCDRCLAPISLPVSGSHVVIVKFGEEEESAAEDDPDVLYLPLETHRWNVAGLIYEFILLTIPVQHTYDCESEEIQPCDKQALERLSPGETIDEGENPFLDALKDIELKN